MPIDSGEPAAAAADLNAALDALAAELRLTGPIPAPEQQAFAAFYHS
ncbi:MAG TPA: hypothetical protein VE871_07785 [Longimicrobium sp.]|nr:hypothetical protein [Longimicrobium sp.]